MIVMFAFVEAIYMIVLMETVTVEAVEVMIITVTTLKKLEIEA